MKILIALALILASANAWEHKLFSYGPWGTAGSNNVYSSGLFSFGLGINMDLMYGTFYNMTQTPAVNGAPGINYWNYGTIIWADVQFWWTAYILNFYNIFWSEYFNLFKLEPLVAQYRWNTDYSNGGWCQMYYWTAQSFTFTQESILNANVFY